MAFWTKKPPSATYSDPISPDNPFASLHGKICLKIREGRAMELNAGKQSWAAQRKWVQEVIDILNEDENSWMPEIQELMMLGDTYYERGVKPIEPIRILARQIRSVEAFAWRLYNKQVI